MLKETADRWKKALVHESALLSDAIRNLDESKLQIVLVVSADNVLLGTITDGDVRRGLLHGKHMSSPVVDFMKRDAMLVPEQMSRDMVIQIMQANKILQVPVVDENSRVVGLHLWNDLPGPVSKRSNTMVIMAGGFGTRMRPHTENCPKPMLPVNGKPILEHIIENAKLEGFQNFILSIHYLGHLIEEHFGNGESMGVNISYVAESSPLGTSGALSLLKSCPTEPFIVTNGDVITDIHYGDMLDFHCHQAACATMAVKQHELQNPFGVVRIEGLEIVGFEEKPVVKSNINAGVYVLDPTALEYLKPDSYCDMPSLFQTLRLSDKRVVAYPVHEDWMDIGRSNDLVRANTELKNG